MSGRKAARTPIDDAFSVRAALRNVRRKVGDGLAAPLDAGPARGRRGPVDAVLAATVVAMVGFGIVMVYTASAVQAADLPGRCLANH